MDLNPAAVEAAAKAIKEQLAAFPFNKHSGFMVDPRMGWGASCEELADAALVAAAPLIVRATADAIADQIEQQTQNECDLHQCSEAELPSASWFMLAGVKRSAFVARSFGSTAPEGPKP